MKDSAAPPGRALWSVMHGALHHLLYEATPPEGDQRVQAALTPAW